MDVVCVKWGNKFSHEHVNRLYRMVQKNLQTDFTFTCYTEDPSNVDAAVRIESLDCSLSLENWWWKLTLFEKPAVRPTLFLDLDIVIQKDITHLFDMIAHQKVTLVKAYWKPYSLKRDYPEYDMDQNSSLMLWTGDMTHIWKDFHENSEYYMLKYKGIDRYLYYHHYPKLEWFPRGEIYSRLCGVDEKNFWKLHKDSQPNYFYERDYTVCIFDGWKKDTDISQNYFLDDEGYHGFEKYWN